LQQSRAFVTRRPIHVGQKARRGKAAWEHAMRRNLTNTVRELSRTFAHLFDSYRPELHYMRGPGPKWRATRAGVATKAAPMARDSAPALREIAKAHA
jgi:hypothetical protein